MHLAYISNRSPERAALRGLALPIYEELGDLLGQANVLNNIGVDAYYEGRWQEALDLYERSKALRERIGDVVGAATITNNIGEVKSDQGYLTTAVEIAEEARSSSRTPATGTCSTHALSNLGRIAAREGRLDDSRKLLHQAREVAEEIRAAGLLVEIEARLAERAVLARRDGRRAGRHRGRARGDRGVRRRLPAPRVRPPDPRLGADAGGRPRSGPRSSRRERGTGPRSGRDLRARAHAGGSGPAGELRGEDGAAEARESKTLLARLGVVSTPDVPL